MNFYKVVIYRSYLCQACKKTWTGIDEDVIACWDRSIRNLVDWVFTPKCGVATDLVHFIRYNVTRGMAFESVMDIIDSLHGRRYMEQAVSAQDLGNLRLTTLRRTST